MFGGSTVFSVPMTLYTDALVIRGTVRAFQRRITDVLNGADPPFLVLEDVSIEEHGSRERPTTASHAQVNLDAVLFAVGEEVIEPRPELRTPKTPEKALISVPPFKVTGSIHLPQREGDLRLALEALVGSFLPVTDAVYWSDRLGEARRTALVVAVNHRRAQILAPYQQEDPWAGLEPSRTAMAAPAGPAGVEAGPLEPATAAAEPGVEDLVGP